MYLPLNVPVNILRTIHIQIWTSQLKRTVQTAKHLNGTVEQWKALNELEVVSCAVCTLAHEPHTTKYTYNSVDMN